MPQSPPTYHDLLNADGSVNRAVYSAILAAKVDDAVNLALCTAARLRVPKGTPYSEVEKVRAALAATVDPSLVSQSERDAICIYQNDELRQRIAAMRFGAPKRRERAA